MLESAWPHMSDEAGEVNILEVADWRLPDVAFLAAFRLPAKTGEGRLARANLFPRERRVSFDEKSHTYTIDGIVAPRSVTGLLHAYADPFDPARAIASMRSGGEWQERRAELEVVGVNVDRAEDIMEHWRFAGDVARARGTLLHFHAEQAANSRRIEEPHSPEFAQVLLLFREFADRAWTPYRAELNIFHCGLRCAGQPDLLCKNAAGHLVIIDWKRASKLPFDNPFGTLRYPFLHLPNSSYWLYAMQLNTYRFFLETEYDMNVDSMWLGLVHPKLSAPRLVAVPRLDDEMATLLEHEISNGRAAPSTPLNAPFALL